MWSTLFESVFVQLFQFRSSVNTINHKQHQQEKNSNDVTNDSFRLLKTLCDFVNWIYSKINLFKRSWIWGIKWKIAPKCSMGKWWRRYRIVQAHQTFYPHNLPIQFCSVQCTLHCVYVHVWPSIYRYILNGYSNTVRIHLTSLHLGPETIHRLYSLWIYGTRALGKATQSNSSYNNRYALYSQHPFYRSVVNFNHIFAQNIKRKGAIGPKKLKLAEWEKKYF